MNRYRIAAGIAAVLTATGVAGFALADAAAPAAGRDEGQAAAAAASDTASATMEGHALGLEGVGNARQLGGYIGADGRPVKDGLLLRTAKLSDATEADLATLVDTYRLGAVVDFRTSTEIASAPDPQIEGVENVWCSVMEETPVEESGDGGKASVASGALAGAAATAQGEDAIAALVAYADAADLEDMYVDLATSEYAQQGYRAFFDVLLDSEDGEAVLWHCTGGKDRAGLATVLLLSALGVDRETVLDDFELTNEFNAAEIEQMGAAAEAAGYSEEQVAAVETLTGVDRSYMEKALDVIDEKYGSMDEYLANQIGLTEDEVAQLQEKYLEA